MTLPTGTISMSQVAAELGVGAAGLSLNAGNVRTLAGVPSGAISMNNLRGKSNIPPLVATGVTSDGGQFSSLDSGGTATATPTVNASGGSGGYAYTWTIVSNLGSMPTLFPAGSTGRVSRNYAKGSYGYFTTTLQCVVTDSGGRSVTVTGIIGQAIWD